MGGGTVQCTDRFRGRGLAKQDEAQEGPAGDGDTQCSVPDMYYGGAKNAPFKFPFHLGQCAAVHSFLESWAV